MNLDSLEDAAEILHQKNQNFLSEKADNQDAMSDMDWQEWKELYIWNSKMYHDAINYVHRKKKHGEFEKTA